MDDDSTEILDCPSDVLSRENSNLMSDENGRAGATASDVELISPNGCSTCLLDMLDIALTDTERRLNTSLQSGVTLRDGYTVYLVETKFKDESSAVRKPDTLENFSSLWRRYSEFEALKVYLQTRYPYIVLPPLPEKRPLFAWQLMSAAATATQDSFQPDFIDRRKAGLEVRQNFLLRVASHKTMSFNNVFIRFLQQEEVWNDSVAVVSYMGKADAKFKSLSASFMLKKPDKRFEEIRNYCNELSGNISNVLKVRSKLANRQYGIFKLHSNYTRVFNQWSPIESEPLANGLEKAANLMAGYSSMSDYLDEEEQFADQMKEYLFYAESLRNVCRNHDLLQYGVERAEENLNAKATQRENLIHGKKSFMSRWFTIADTEDSREIKLQQIEGQLHEAEDQCRRSSEDARQFVSKAVEEIESFQHQKAKDLKETLLLFAILQIKMCKKGLTQWQSMRDCFDEM